MFLQARLTVYLKLRKMKLQGQEILDHDSGDVTSCDMDSGSDDSDDCIDEMKMLIIYSE